MRARVRERKRVHKNSMRAREKKTERGKGGGSVYYYLTKKLFVRWRSRIAYQAFVPARSSGSNSLWDLLL